MIGTVKRAYASFRGFDEPGSAVPMMDGPLKPNTALDAAPTLLALPAVDNLTPTPAGIVCSSGNELLRLEAAADGSLAVAARETFASPITCIATNEAGGLAIGLDGHGIVLRGGGRDGTTIGNIQGTSLNCPTAALFLDTDTLIVANGAASQPAAEWKRDLMTHGASGIVWRGDLKAAGPAWTALGRGLAFPTGIARSAGGLLVAEAWRHRLISFDPSASGPATGKLVAGDFPAYPGRIVAAESGGFWLAMFAPRNQLVEFVLREDRYRRRMIERIDPAYWIAPALSSGASFLEPVQGGARKKLNIMKPWAPTWSYGLVVRCDTTTRPTASLHSRADGHVHGVTSLCESDGRLIVGAKGSGVVVGLDTDAQRGWRIG